MTDPIIDTDSAATAAAAVEQTTQPFDPKRLIEDVMCAIEALRDSEKETLRKLKSIKKTEDVLLPVITNERALIVRLLDLRYAPETIADILESVLKPRNHTFDRRKLLNAIKACAVADDGTPKKRRGRPPKNAAAVSANTDASLEVNAALTGQGVPVATAGQQTAASVTQSVIATAKNPVPAGVIAQINPAPVSANSRINTAPVSANSQKIPALASEIPAFTGSIPIPAASSPRPDSPAEIERYRGEAPSWVSKYRDDKRYGAVVARHDGESNPDYFWRMWHTAPPWSGEYEPRPDETQAQYHRRCWGQKSPEERAAHERSLPSTAR
jgi:hypothetical protein